ncbi:MAG: glycosyltransferase family 2 protein [Hyphomicrobium sp.]
MMVPYASVILSTLNRSSTLPYALASVQGQSEKRLEIFLVLDGATPACREIAFAAAREDARIRIFDLAKDSGRGEFNVDFALSQCSSERIFYIDDDDLWLTHHVARLGPLLDHADVADSRVCSVDRAGALHLGPSRGANARIRALLGTARLKTLYDTHMAHRKDAYGRYATWFSHPETGYAVWGLMAGFANNPECRWVSCDEVTALSIHGAARPDMSPEARTKEIAHWAAQIGARDAALDVALARADCIFHLFRLLMTDPPQGGTLDDYLALRGGYGEDFSNRPERDLFALFTPSPPAEPAAITLACALSEAVEAGSLFEAITLAYFNAYGQSGHERILLAAARRDGANPAYRLAAYSVAVCRRDVPAALALARDALSLGPDPIGSLARWENTLARLAATPAG